MSELDAIVIAAGPAGEVCAGRLGDAGLSVAVVEAEQRQSAPGGVRAVSIASQR